MTTLTLLLPLALAAGCLVVSIWCARKALQANASAKEGWAAAAYWQRECGCISPDAAKWRLHRAARIRRDVRRTLTQRAPVLAMVEKLKEGQG